MLKAHYNTAYQAVSLMHSQSVLQNMYGNDACLVFMVFPNLVACLEPMHAGDLGGYSLLWKKALLYNYSTSDVWSK